MRGYNLKRGGGPHPKMDCLAKGKVDVCCSRKRFESMAALLKSAKSKGKVDLCCSRKKRKKLRNEGPEWVNLPYEITSMILQKIGTVEILRSARRVCKTWSNICKDPAMWRVIIIDEDDKYSENYDLLRLCCEAVDLSQGELLDIQVPGNDKLMHYIGKRSSKLRRVVLTKGFHLTSTGPTSKGLTSEGLKAILAGCPDLEYIDVPRNRGCKLDKLGERGCLIKHCINDKIRRDKHFIYNKMTRDRRIRHLAFLQALINQRCSNYVKLRKQLLEAKANSHYAKCIRLYKEAKKQACEAKKQACEADKRDREAYMRLEHEPGPEPKLAREAYLCNVRAREVYLGTLKANLPTLEQAVDKLLSQHMKNHSTARVNLD